MCFFCELAQTEAAKEIHLAICGECGAMILGLPMFLAMHEEWHRTHPGSSWVEWAVKAGDN